MHNVKKHHIATKIAKSKNVIRKGFGRNKCLIIKYFYGMTHRYSIPQLLLRFIYQRMRYDLRYT